MLTKCNHVPKYIIQVMNVVDTMQGKPQGGLDWFLRAIASISSLGDEVMELGDF